MNADSGNGGVDAGIKDLIVVADTDGVGLARVPAPRMRQETGQAPGYSTPAEFLYRISGAEARNASSRCACSDVGASTPLPISPAMGVTSS